MNEKDFEYFYQSIKEQAYICSHCGKIIFPQVDWENKEINQDKCQIRGGIGNKIMKDNICRQCAKDTVLIADMLSKCMIPKYK